MLTGRQIEQAQNALLEAFPSRDALRMLARIELNENLDAIAGGDNLRVIAFNLVSWAEQTGVFARLVDGAVRQNGGNATLRELQAAARSWAASPPRDTMERSRATVEIFLSYSQHDRTKMYIVHDVLSRAGFSVWLDEELKPGTLNWEEAIEDAIHQAHAVVALLSPHARESPSVRREIQYAQVQKKRVFTLLIDGDAATAVPINLSDGYWVDGRLNTRSAVAEGLLPEIQRHFGRAVTRRPIYFEWVEIPSGPFLMGSDKHKDRRAWAEEMPQHSVTLPAYRVARIPVTVAQFAAFVDATGHETEVERRGSAYVWNGQEWGDVKGANWQYPSGPGSDVRQKQDHPVTGVTWRDANAFCRWASEAASLTIRLPTEAEWEKAARGTDGRIYPWGDEKPTEAHCNFDMKVGDTTPVRQFLKGKSPYGVLDMSGNVWEWTSTEWEENYCNYIPNDGLENGETRIARGGSFYVVENCMRCACRFNFTTPNFYVGFRVVSPGF